VDRFYVESDQLGDAGERLAVDWLGRETQTRGVSGAVVMPSVDSIGNLAGAIGREAAEFAKQNRFFEVARVRIDVFTDRTLPGLFAGVLLVPWANEAMIGSMEERRPAAICATTAEGQLINWQRAHRPVDLRTGEPWAGDEAQLAPLVVQALTSLTASINHATGIHHPSDARQARRLLKAVFIVGEPLDPVEIRTWALANRWQPRHADALAELAGKIAAGKRVKGAAMNKSEAKKIVGQLRGLME
jgi:hypothetical protein